VDIYRDGSPIATDLPPKGSYTDNIGEKGGATYIYEVCEANIGPSAETCSAAIAVVF
jgi:hypothetical protein